MDFAEGAPPQGLPTDWRTAQFNVRPHRPDGGIGSVGLVLLPGVAIVTAVILGALAGGMTQVFYLIVVIPAAMGAGLGCAANVAIRLGHVRNTVFGVVVVTLAGVLMVMVMHYVEFRLVWLELPPNVQDTLTFPQFIDASARRGVAIYRAGLSDRSGMNLGYYGTYAYWAGEALIAIAIASMIGFGGVARPYCTRCGLWKTPKTLGAACADSKKAAEALRSGQPAAFARLPRYGVPIVIKFFSCDSCTDDDVEIQAQSIQHDENGKPSYRDIGVYTYPSQAVEAWEFAVQHAASEEQDLRSNAR